VYPVQTKVEYKPDTRVRVLATDEAFMAEQAAKEAAIVAAAAAKEARRAQETAARLQVLQQQLAEKQQRRAREREESERDAARMREEVARFEAEVCGAGGGGARVFDCACGMGWCEAERWLQWLGLLKWVCLGRATPW
jgi:hypothetical protein